MKLDHIERQPDESAIDSAKAVRAGTRATTATGSAREMQALPAVDVMIVCYNSERWLDGFVDGLSRLDYPADRLRLVCIDNGSKDRTVERLRAAATKLPFAVEIVAGGQNRGFAGGYSEAFRRGAGEYYFVVNVDTVVESDAVRRLIGALQLDATIGIAEAKQAPNEHPKYYDPITGETSWCSGACMMVRATALQQVGGFYEPFFMYAEDVDLSWRMWLHGWRCVYVPEAVVQHFTEQLDPDRNPQWQHYFSMRNGALMRVMYGSRADILYHYAAMLRVAILSRAPMWHRRLVLKAMVGSWRRLGAAWKERRTRAARGGHPWVFFNGWLYGRHARDLALAHESTDLVDALATAERRVDRPVSTTDHIVVRERVRVGGIDRRAIQMFDTAEVVFHVDVTSPTDLCGAFAAPEDAWKPDSAAVFTVRQDEEVICREELQPRGDRLPGWRPFQVRLSRAPEGRLSRIALRFEQINGLEWGLIGDLRLKHRASPMAPETGGGAGRDAPRVSIVIPTHNRCDRVGRVIRRIMTQDVPRETYEVIVVDSNSSDDTRAVLRRLEAEYDSLKARRCERPGAAAARNLGLAEARGELIILLDDDILVGSDFLRKYLAAYRWNGDRVLLGQIVAPWEDSVDPFHRYLMQAQDVNRYDFADPSDVPASYFYTACVGIPRAALRGLRFDDSFMVYGVEDIEFGYRLLRDGVRMTYVPEIEVWHEYFPHYGGFRKKKYKAGYSLGYFLEQHPGLATQFTFERRIRWMSPLVRATQWLLSPLAGLSYVFERIRYRGGPVGRLLYRWMYFDLRLRMYAGMRRFRRGATPPH